MSIKKNREKIIATAKKAEKSLREIIAEGGRISQAAVEKRAGLSNGSLNYNVPEYKDIKHRIHLAKQSTNAHLTVNKSDSLKGDTRLKDKYRSERDNLREELRKVLGQKVELQHKLFELQQYVKYLESKGFAHSNVVNFRPNPKVD
jgi:predicted nuclease with TOPRIM domain